jgi:predicted TIM-barrel fold metal-dependent hydrolase
LSELPASLVDGHVHVFTPGDGLHRMWLEDDSFTGLGDVRPLRGVDWGPERLGAELDGFGVEALVHVQSADAADAVAETRWLAGLAPEWPLLRAIVGAGELTSPGFAAELDQHLAATPLFRGIRDLSFDFDPSAGPEELEPGLRALAGRDLAWEATCPWEGMGTVLECARRHPDLRVMLVHVGVPPAAGEGRREWARAVSALATAANVQVKISGLGTPYHRLDPEATRPAIEHCLAAFGPERCVWGSNFPVDRLYGSYREALELVASAALGAGLSRGEREDLFGGTAKRFYRLWPHD